MIRFLSNWRGYAPDDTATLNPATEERLTAIGVAEHHDPAPPTPAPTKATAPKKAAAGKAKK